MLCWAVPEPSEARRSLEVLSGSGEVVMGTPTADRDGNLGNCILIQVEASDIWMDMVIATQVVRLSYL